MCYKLNLTVNILWVQKLTRITFQKLSKLLCIKTAVLRKYCIMWSRLQLHYSWANGHPPSNIWNSYLFHNPELLQSIGALLLTLINIRTAAHLETLVCWKAKSRLFPQLAVSLRAHWIRWVTTQNGNHGSNSRHHLEGNGAQEAAKLCVYSKTFDNA